MKKQTYLRKLEEIKITDDMTVADAKRAKTIKRTLERYWKRAAFEYAVKNDLMASNVQRMYRVDYDHTLKVGGFVKISLWFEPGSWGDFGAIHQSPSLTKEIRIPKRELLT